MNIFEAVKENVTTLKAAQSYGIQVNRNGMALCPFHNDKNPSMKVDKRFHCFGCQADGDVIDFTARLYSISVREAVEKLAVDFSIDYNPWERKTFKPVKKKISEELRFRQSVHKCIRVFSDYYHLLEKWKKQYAPQELGGKWHPLFEEAMQKHSYAGYILDVLLFGTVEEKAAIIEEHRKEILRLESRISDLSVRFPTECKKHRQNYKGIPER